MQNNDFASADTKEQSEGNLVEGSASSEPQINGHDEACPFCKYNISSLRLQYSMAYELELESMFILFRYVFAVEIYLYLLQCVSQD